MVMFHKIEENDDELVTLDDIKQMVRQQMTRRRAKNLIKTAFFRTWDGDSAARAWILSCLADDPPLYSSLPERKRKPIEVREIRQ